MINKTTFSIDLNCLGINLSDNQLCLFDRYFDLLISENKKFNLTSITDRDEVYKKHFIDSLSICKYDFNFSQNLKVIDVGSGAGFPGIPLKIVFPELDITLVDSLNKRVGFLEDVISSLNLQKINAIHGRAEELAHMPTFREQFDICVSRAVANLNTLSEYCLPFVKVGGLFISYKSENIESELDGVDNCLSLLGGELDKQVFLTLPYSDISRILIGINKINNTPIKYPRRAGLPGKRPLR